MEISRRAAIIRGGLALPVAALLARCELPTLGSVVTIAETDLGNAAAILAGVNSIVGLANAGKGIPSKTVDAITAYAGDAAVLLKTWTAGAVVPVTSVNAFFIDVEAVANAATPLFPGNPYLLAINVALPLLASAWGIATASAATTGGMTAAQAIALLKTLPQPAHG